MERGIEKHFQDGSIELQIPPLRSPGFPVELGGVGALHAAFLNESSKRGYVQRCVEGNPGPFEMTNLFQGYFRTFPGKSGLALKQICHPDRRSHGPGAHPR